VRSSVRVVPFSIFKQYLKYERRASWINDLGDVPSQVPLRGSGSYPLVSDPEDDLGIYQQTISAYREPDRAGGIRATTTAAKRTAGCSRIAS
jgi:hypothetical protein